MPVKVLSVDDNKTISFIVNGALKPYDCVVFEAANGEEGLVAASRENPDLILLDVNMPVMDGVTMLAKLRENSALSNIPVIMLTAWSDGEKVSHIAKLGIRDYLVKPFTKDQLLEKVGRSINLQRRSPAGAPCVTPPPVRPDGFKGAGFAQRYGLEPIPESVACLAALVAQQDADLDAIGKIITNDKAMSARLLRAANPLYSNEKEYEITTVEQVLMLKGLSCVFLLTMGDLVVRALLKTFRTMLGVELETAGSKTRPPKDELLVLSEVEFSGKAFGRIRLRLGQRSARLVAARVLGVDQKELDDAARVDDAICELTNMVVGNFLSNLADAGLDSKLSSPRVGRTEELNVHSISGGITERLAFRSSELSVFLDVSVDPWRR
jgi:DNA-binding response OmpR family regulator/CheY-specific phosphatase CheX